MARSGSGGDRQRNLGQHPVGRAPTGGLDPGCGRRLPSKAEIEPVEALGDLGAFPAAALAHAGERHVRGERPSGIRELDPLPGRCPRGVRGESSRLAISLKLAAAK